MRSSVDPLLAEALEQVGELLARAQHTALREPTAMSLATAAADGQPDVRIVLLREYDERGFVFYTNTESPKARQLAANPRAALCLHWDELQEQLRVQGDVEPVSQEQADAYWVARPRDSQIGAWASRQSEPLDSPEVLAARVVRYEQEFRNREVARPPFWSGYRVVPQRIEFWHGRPARLHERVVYERGTPWTKQRLYP